MMNRMYHPFLSITRSIKYNSLYLTQVRHAFYNKYRHGPSDLLNPKPDYKKLIREIFTKEGATYSVKEIYRLTLGKLFVEEKEHYQANKTYIFEHFDSDECIKRWKPVSDSDSLNGYSTSSIVKSPDGHGLFKGILDNRLPQDGITQKSGFAGIVGPAAPRQRLLNRDGHYDWDYFNCIEIRFRGDGRKYAIVANVGTYDNDLSYFDIFFHPLYTRGGPYWETRKIYFSKMVFAYKSFIQNEQSGLPGRVKFVAITLEDTYDGPFALEIDYIGLRKDLGPVDEQCAYETYNFPHLKFRNVQVECDPPEQNN